MVFKKIFEGNQLPPFWKNPKMGTRLILHPFTLLGGGKGESPSRNMLMCLIWRRVRVSYRFPTIYKRIQMAPYKKLREILGKIVDKLENPKFWGDTPVSKVSLGIIKRFRP